MKLNNDKNNTQEDIQPQGNDIPIGAIFLSLVVAVCIGALFYFESTEILSLVETRNDQRLSEQLAQYRWHGAILGALVGLAFFTLFLFLYRRSLNALNALSNTIDSYRDTGEILDLPVNQPGNVGVIARSVNNLMRRIDETLADYKSLVEAEKESSDKLEAIVENVADAFITINEFGQMQTFNQAAENMFGYRSEEVVGKNVAMLMPSEHANRHDNYLSSYTKTGKTSIMGVGRELEGRKKDGSQFAIHLAISEVETSQGKIYTGIIRDINQEKEFAIERERNQKELKAERERLDEIIRATNVGTWEWNLETDTININDRWALMAGYEPNELPIEHSAAEQMLCHPDDIKVSKRKLDRVFKNQESVYSCEIRIKNKSGDWFWVLDKGSIVEWSENGLPKRMSGTRLDVNKAKEAERRTKALNERMSIAADSAGIGVWEFNFQTGKLMWDDWMFRIYGVDYSSFRGELSDWSNTLHPDDVDRMAASMESAVEGNLKFDAEFRIIQPNSKELRYIKASAIIKKDEQGKPTTMVGVNFDITDSKLAENKLVSAKELAEEAVMMKSEFLASMSHEIRTPMNGVMGMLGLLQRDNLTPDQAHKASIAQSSAKSLLTLINDILDFSKIEAGKLDLELIDFDLRSLLGEFAESMAQRAQEKGIELILDVSEIEQSRVRGDSGRLRQVLNNLVGNAIKFTDWGEVVIRASLTSQNENKLRFNCSVKDTGIGIPQEKLPILFDSFTQVDASTTRQYGGTGLGLAISKQLCQLMSGDIQVQSKVHEGSEFRFSIELEASDFSEKIVPVVDIKGVPILVVDDNETNRTVLTQQLKIWGATVYEAVDGESTLQFLQDEASPEIKVVFLDMQMPGISGGEVGEAIRKQTQFDSLKLIIMTSISTQGGAKHFADMGFDAYFPKPATTSDLFDALSIVLADGKKDSRNKDIITSELLKTMSRESDNTNEALLSQLKDIRILLVEDNQINQEVALNILAEYGATADVAADGLEAIDSLKRAQTLSPYQIVLMDCQMPVMDGYEATRQIRAGISGDELTHIPIIAMTANAMKGDMEKCFDAGMSDYLSKPVDPELLLSKLLLWSNKVHIKKSNLDLPTIEQPVVEEVVSDDQVWDEASALKRMVGKQSLLLKLVHLFLDEMPARVEKLTSAIKSNNIEEVKQLAHTIKGVAGNLSAAQLQQSAADIELAAKNEDLAEANKVFGQFKQRYLLTVELLESRVAKEETPQVLEIKSVDVRSAKQQTMELIKKLEASDFIDLDEVTALEKNLPEINKTLIEGLYRQVELFEVDEALKSAQTIMAELEAFENEG